MRVLVVDDYPGAAHAVCILLELLGHEATMASSGREAVLKSAELAPDVVILDIGLPDLHGYEVARQLRALRKPPFIAAMTGWTDAENTQSLQAGIDKHVVKPACAEKLREIMDAARVRVGAAATAEPSAEQ